MSVRDAGNGRAVTEALSNMSVARALLLCRCDELGGIEQGRLAFNRDMDLSVKRDTWRGWVAYGGTIPSGDPVYQGGRLVQKPLRSLVLDWLGLREDRWWWTPLRAEHLRDEADPEPRLPRLIDVVPRLPEGFRPPEGSGT